MFGISEFYDPGVFSHRADGIACSLLMWWYVTASCDPRA
jgi:hypothetical protein